MVVPFASVKRIHNQDVLLQIAGCTANMDLRKISMDVKFVNVMTHHVQKTDQFVQCFARMALRKMQAAVKYANVMNALQTDAECCVNMASKWMKMDAKYANVMKHHVVLLQQDVKCIVPMAMRRMQMVVTYANVTSVQYSSAACIANTDSKKTPTDVTYVNAITRSVEITGQSVPCIVNMASKKTTMVAKPANVKNLCVMK